LWNPQLALARLRKVAAHLGCRYGDAGSAPQGYPTDQSTSQGAWASASHGGAPSNAHDDNIARHQGGGEGEDDDDDDDVARHQGGGEGEDDGDDDVDYDELAMSQLDDAPQGTQQSSRCPHRISKPMDQYTPSTYPFGRGKRYTRRAR
jgi:hypothetical protein